MYISNSTVEVTVPNHDVETYSADVLTFRIIGITFMSLVSFCTFLAYLHPCWCFNCRGADGIKVVYLAEYFLQMWVLLTDINLSHTIISLATFENFRNTTIFALAIGSPVFIIIPYSVNIYTAIKISRKFKMNGVAYHYFEKRFAFFCFLVSISGGCWAALRLVSSRIFGLDMFDCGFTSREWLQFGNGINLRLKYSVLLENLPQLMVQITYIITLGHIDEAVLYALICTGFMIVLAPLEWIFTKIDNEDFENQLILKMDICLDSNANNFNRDLKQCTAQLGYRDKLAREISFTLEFLNLHGMINIFKIVPSNTGCVMNIEYLYDVHSSGIHRIADIGAKSIGKKRHVFSSSSSSSLAQFMSSDRNNSAAKSQTSQLQVLLDTIVSGDAMSENEIIIINTFVNLCENKLKDGIPLVLQKTWNLQSLPSITCFRDDDDGFGLGTSWNAASILIYNAIMLSTSIEDVLNLNQENKAIDHAISENKDELVFSDYDIYIAKMISTNNKVIINDDNTTILANEIKMDEKDDVDIEIANNTVNQSKSVNVIGRWAVDDAIIGKGAFSSVIKGVDMEHKSVVVAVKLMEKKEKKQKEIQWSASNEVKCLTKISHENVIQLLAYHMGAKYKNENVIMFVLEYAARGELTNLVSELGSAFDEKLARTHFRQIMSGLEACHNAGIVHRDIKLQNILLDSRYNIKICDFGLSKLTTDKDLCIKAHLVGTPGFTAPEVLKRENYNNSCDIFSAGVVLFAMLTKRMPFGKVVVKLKNKENAYEYTPKYQLFINKNVDYWQKLERNTNSRLSLDAKEILIALLDDNPSNRLQFGNINEYSWYMDSYFESEDIAYEIRRKKFDLTRKKLYDKSYAKHEKLDKYCQEILKNEKTLIYCGLLPTLPQDITETCTYDDLYTTVDWRVVYETVSKFVTIALMGKVAYKKEQQILVCTTSYPTNVEFSFRMFRSTKWCNNKNPEATKGSDNFNVYRVHMERLKGDGLVFNKIKEMLFSHDNCKFVFTGLPAWAALGDIKTEFTQIQKQTFVKHYKKSIKYTKSLLSGLSMISHGNASINFKTDLTYYIRNPLVILMSIGEYDSGVMPSLTGVTQDYVNSIYTFNHRLGYSLVYQNKMTNKIEYLTRTSKDDVNQNKNKLSLNKCKNNVKIRWTEDEIIKFFENVKDTVKQNMHDGCIFIVSAHGEAESVVIDSEGEEVSLGLLFANFNGKYCKYLADKPKLIFVDACRGSMRAKPISTVKLPVNDNNNATDSNVNNDHDSDAKTNDNQEYKSPAMIDAKYINDENSKITENMIRINDKYYHEQANFRYIYGNPDGFAVPDGGDKGGYLIRAIKRVFSNLEISLNSNLDEIVNKIRSQVSEMVGKGTQATVEDVNTMTYKIVFRRK